MKYSLHISKTLIVTLLLLSVTSSSWAWRGGGWRGGWGGSRVGVYVGSGLGWYGPYDPYYYNPYYPYYVAPYYPPYYPYAAPGQPPATLPPQGMQAAPDNSRRNPGFLDDQIARARTEIDYEYEDGDISRAAHDAEVSRLSRIAQEAHAQANGGTLTEDQESGFLRQIGGGSAPESSPRPSNASPNDPRRDLKMVNEELIRLRTLLDKKVANADITKTQRDGMSDRLTRIDQQIQSEASANGGTLGIDQENNILLQLENARASIERNFVVN